MHFDPHYALYVSSKENKAAIIAQLTSGKLLPADADLAHKKGALFSRITLNTFLDEEYRHDRFELTADPDHLLSSLSEGEQKKALLAYLLAGKPDYLIVDNIFDNLDTRSQQSILQTLTESARHLLIIQLANRERDFLPFIRQVYQVENGVLHARARTASTASPRLAGDIPAPGKAFQPIANPLVRMRNICVAFDDKRVLNNIDWQINAGEFWQLTGPNGAGKSTLLSLITGDSPKAYQQDLCLFGQQKGSGESIWDIKKNIGYFTNNINQNFSRRESVENMVISGFFDSIGLYAKPARQQVDLARQWLALVGLQDVRKQAFANLSLGHQRLVLAIRAMVKHPPLLILDEPVAGLDDDDVQLFTALVNAMAAHGTSAILYVSHREEPGLQPGFRFELTPSAQGSTGKVIRKG